MAFQSVVLALLLGVGILPIPALPLVVIGDSISQGYGATTGYVQRLGVPSTVIAQGGATTGMMLAKLPQVTALHPETVIVELGTNDIRWSVPIATFTGNYEAILAGLNGVRQVICLSLWPSPGYTNTAPYNNVIKRLCRFYIDIARLATLQNTNATNWHPNDAGAAAIAHAVELRFPLEVAMNWNMLVALQPIVVSVILPALGAALLSLYHRLPAQRQELLDTLLHHVVLAVEQLGSSENLTAEQKKGLAMDFAHAALKRVGITLPATELSMMIEATVAGVLNADKLLNGAATVQPVIGFHAPPNEALLAHQDV